MLIYLEESIFSSPAKVLVNTVNTVGVMGKGLAFEFKKLYPDMFDAYQIQCEEGRFDIGSLLLYKTSNKWVLNFPTKKHWRSPSRAEYIEAGLNSFVERFRDFEISSISFPQLGCGHGELDWETQVRPLMEKYLSQLSIDVFIHIYSASFDVEHRVTNEMKEWLRGTPRSLSVFEVWNDLFGTDMPDTDPSLALSSDASERDARNAVILRSIWGRLRTYGMISEIEVHEQYGKEGSDLFDRLAGLSYIERSTFAAPSAISVIPPASTRDLLAQPEAKGLRLVPESVPHRYVALPMWG